MQASVSSVALAGRAALAPMAGGVKVHGRTPFTTPWRTIQLADRAEDLSPSLIGLNLNPPSVLASTDWIKPMKYIGIWWGMHINTMTWSSGPKHGATTANMRRYIDFAAANGNVHEAARQLRDLRHIQVGGRLHGRARDLAQQHAVV